MSETTVQAPPVEAPAETVETPAKPAKSLGDKIAESMAKPPAETHVDFINWLSEHGVEDIDIRSVQAAMSLYNVFRATPEFQAKREQAKAERKAAGPKSQRKPVSEMTPEEAQAELAKVAAAQQAAETRAANEAARKAEVLKLLADAGIVVPTAEPVAESTDEVDEASEPDEATDEAF